MDFKGFCPDVYQIKAFGVRLHTPASYTTGSIRQRVAFLESYLPFIVIK